MARALASSFRQPPLGCVDATADVPWSDGALCDLTLYLQPAGGERAVVEAAEEHVRRRLAGADAPFLSRAEAAALAGPDPAALDAVVGALRDAGVDARAPGRHARGARAGPVGAARRPDRRRPDALPHRRRRPGRPGGRDQPRRPGPRPGGRRLRARQPARPVVLRHQVPRHQEPRHQVARHQEPHRPRRHQVARRPDGHQEPCHQEPRHQVARHQVARRPRRRDGRVEGRGGPRVGGAGRGRRLVRLPGGHRQGRAGRRPRLQRHARRHRPGRHGRLRRRGADRVLARGAAPDRLRRPCRTAWCAARATGPRGETSTASTSPTR